MYLVDPCCILTLLDSRVPRAGAGSFAETFDSPFAEERQSSWAPSIASRMESTFVNKHTYAYLYIYILIVYIYIYTMDSLKNKES